MASPGAFFFSLLVLGLLLFVLPPVARLWVAAMIFVVVLAGYGKNAAGVIDSLRRRIYGP
jgi:hypothetical protein